MSEYVGYLADSVRLGLRSWGGWCFLEGWCRDSSTGGGVGGGFRGCVVDYGVVLLGGRVSLGMVARTWVWLPMLGACRGCFALCRGRYELGVGAAAKDLACESLPIKTDEIAQEDQERVFGQTVRIVL